MSHTFGKGTVARSLEDGYKDYIFNNLLGWRYNFAIGSGSTNSGLASTICLPYMGEAQLPASNSCINNPLLEQKAFSPGIDGINLNPYEPTTQEEEDKHSEFEEYVRKFRLFLTPDDGYHYTEGASISVLKKDGTWNLVYFEPGVSYVQTINMRDWTFNCNPTEYARTADGHLRVRHTLAKSTLNGTQSAATYFVADYLPQTIELKAQLHTQALMAVNSNDVFTVSNEP